MFEIRVPRHHCIFIDLILNQRSSPLEFVFSEFRKLRFKLSRLRLFRDSIYLFLRDRDFSRLQIFKSNETKTFPRLQFWIIRDRDFPRIGKNCRNQEFGSIAPKLSPHGRNQNFRQNGEYLDSVKMADFQKYLPPSRKQLLLGHFWPNSPHFFCT